MDETTLHLIFIGVIFLIVVPFLKGFTSPLNGSQEAFQKALNKAERKLRAVGLMNSAMGPSEECVPCISLIAEENPRLAIAYVTIEIKKIFEFEEYKYKIKLRAATPP